jgi:hypothetical protein
MGMRIRERLLWDAARGQTVIRYRDARSGDSFVAVVPAQRALEAFRHPNAYREARA